MTMNTPTSGQEVGAPQPARKSTLRVVLLAVGSIVVVIILALTALSIILSQGRENTSGTFAVTEHFDAINLNSSAADVKVDYEAVSQPELRFDQGDTNLRFEHSVSGGELRLKVQNPVWWWNFGNWGLSHRTASLHIVLPQSQEGENLALTFDGTAGNMDVLGKFGDIQLKSTAGNVQLRGSAANLEITTTAGNARLTDYSVAGSFRSDSTAGDSRFVFSTLPEHIDVKSTAGNVGVVLPKGKYRIEAHTTAGEVRQNVSSDASASRIYRFETTAGNIDLSER